LHADSTTLSGISICCDYIHWRRLFIVSSSFWRNYFWHWMNCFIITPPQQERYGGCYSPRGATVKYG